MADVAREAGVSLMTVSRAVNGKGEISDETRERIQAVIKRLGYRPSGIARSLATNHTATVGLVVLDNTNPFFSEIARGVEQVAYETGYKVFLCNTDEDIEREAEMLHSLEEKRVDGVILGGSRLDDASLYAGLRRHPAAVLVNRVLTQGSFGTVLVNDAHGTRCAVEHLIRAGHRAIGFLAGPPHSYSGHQRAAAYRATLKDAGLLQNVSWEQGGAPTVAGGQTAARQLLAAHPELTALFCYNDLTAVGALQACAAMGLDVPGDVAIVGFDDIPMAAIVTPALTTCHVPTYTLGRHAMDLLLAHICGCSEECENIVVQPELMVRASAPRPSPTYSGSQVSG
jgi:LacI family transcriptional regulator